MDSHEILLALRIARMHMIDHFPGFGVNRDSCLRIDGQLAKAARCCTVTHLLSEIQQYNKQKYLYFILLFSI